MSSAQQTTSHETTPQRYAESYVKNGRVSFRRDDLAFLDGPSKLMPTIRLAPDGDDYLALATIGLSREFADLIRAYCHVVKEQEIYKKWWLDKQKPLCREGRDAHRMLNNARWDYNHWYCRLEEDKRLFKCSSAGGPAQLTRLKREIDEAEQQESELKERYATFARREIVYEEWRIVLQTRVMRIIYDLGWSTALGPHSIDFDPSKACPEEYFEPPNDIQIPKYPWLDPEKPRSENPNDNYPEDHYSEDDYHVDSVLQHQRQNQRSLTLAEEEVRVCEENFHNARRQLDEHVDYSVKYRKQRADFFVKNADRPTADVETEFSAMRLMEGRQLAQAIEETEKALEEARRELFRLTPGIHPDQTSDFRDYSEDEESQFHDQCSLRGFDRSLVVSWIEAVEKPQATPNPSVLRTTRPAFPLSLRTLEMWETLSDTQEGKAKQKIENWAIESKQQWAATCLHYPELIPEELMSKAVKLAERQKSSITSTTLHPPSAPHIHAHQPNPDHNLDRMPEQKVPQADTAAMLSSQSPIYIDSSSSDAGSAATGENLENGTALERQENSAASEPQPPTVLQEHLPTAHEPLTSKGPKSQPPKFSQQQPPTVPQEQLPTSHDPLTPKDPKSRPHKSPQQQLPKAPRSQPLKVPRQQAPEDSQQQLPATPRPENPPVSDHPSPKAREPQLPKSPRQQPSASREPQHPTPLAQGAPKGRAVDIDLKGNVRVSKKASLSHEMVDPPILGEDALHGLSKEDLIHEQQLPTPPDRLPQATLNPQPPIGPLQQHPATAAQPVATPQTVDVPSTGDIPVNLQQKHKEIMAKIFPRGVGVDLYVNPLFEPDQTKPSHSRGRGRQGTVQPKKFQKVDSKDVNANPTPPVENDTGTGAWEGERRHGLRLRPRDKKVDYYEPKIPPKITKPKKPANKKGSKKKLTDSAPAPAVVAENNAIQGRGQDENTMQNEVPRETVTPGQEIHDTIAVFVPEKTAQNNKPKLKKAANKNGSKKKTTDPARPSAVVAENNAIQGRGQDGDTIRVQVPGEMITPGQEIQNTAAALVPEQAAQNDKTKPKKPRKPTKPKKPTEPGKTAVTKKQTKVSAPQLKPGVKRRVEAELPDHERLDATGAPGPETHNPLLTIPAISPADNPSHDTLMPPHNIKTPNEYPSYKRQMKQSDYEIRQQLNQPAKRPSDTEDADEASAPPKKKNKVLAKPVSKVKGKGKR